MTLELWRGGGFVRCRRVDDLTADRTVVWMNTFDGGRILFHAVDDVKV